MFQPVKSLDEALAAVTDGCMLVVPREVSGVPMAGDARADPPRRQAAASGGAADLQPAGGSADRRRLHRDAGDERGQPRRVRPGAAFHRRGHVGTIKMMDATCPALHAALQAAEKGVPFMPLRGLIGSDVLEISRRLEGDRLPVRQCRSDRAVAGDQAGRRAVPCADGRPLRQCLDRAPARTRHHGACGGEDRRHRGENPRRQSARRSACSPPARCPASMSRASRWPSAAPGRCRCPIITPPTPSIWRCMRRWRRRRRALPSIWSKYVYERRAA